MIPENTQWHGMKKIVTSTMNYFRSNFKFRGILIAYIVHMYMMICYNRSGMYWLTGDLLRSFAAKIIDRNISMCIAKFSKTNQI